ncbi:unnamed protein product [Jaminaea pallidilutea]
MGNAPSSSASRVPLGVSSLVAELGDNEVQYEKGLGASRFLKAVRARHTHGKIVVKTFIKPDPSLTLRHLMRRLRKEREMLAGVPNVLTYQHVIEADNAGYLVRQWLSSSLYDRISTRPFLTTIEKKWVTYQLLFAMKACRDKDIAHGDLKTENVLVTTSLSVYVSDFAASFKPVYLPLDDPADFAFFFDTSGRRTCYVAPERFYTADSETARQKAILRTGAATTAATANIGSTSITSSQDPYSEILGLNKRDGKVTEAMDVFSLGCVIAELWRDGTPTFTLSQLFKYREGQFDLASVLSEISEQPIRSMVKRMLSLDADQRGDFSDHLRQANQECFPESFSSFLHPYLVELQRTSPPHAETNKTMPASGSTNANAKAGPSLAPSAPSASDAETYNRLHEQNLHTRRQADATLDRMYEEWSVIIGYLDDSAVLDVIEKQEGGVSDALGEFAEEGGITGQREAAERVLPVQLGIPNLVSSDISHYRRSTPQDGPALVVLSPILSNLRNALRATTKVHTLDMLMHLSAGWLSDDAKLDRVLPYVVALYDDPSPQVRAAAIRTSVQLLLLVDAITPANESVCPEYVFPNIRRLGSDPSTMVRRTYSACFADLLSAAERFIQQCQALRASGALAADQDGIKDFLDSPAFEESTFDGQMTDLRAFASEQTTALLTDTATDVKRVFLANIRPICRLFGVNKTNDVLLSHMITYLNDRDWLLRDAFFQAIVDVALIGGPGSIEEYIAPLLLQALSDPEELVTRRVLNSFQELARASLLNKHRIYELVVATSGFLCHPNIWIRQAEARLLETLTAGMDSTELWAVIYPLFRPLVKAELVDPTTLSILETAKAPLSRPIMQSAVHWASTAAKTSFWRKSFVEGQKERNGQLSALSQEGLSLIAGAEGSAKARTPMPRTEEDDGFMDKLRSQGLGAQDEVKLFALRDYMWKLARDSGGRRRLPVGAGEDVETSGRRPFGLDAELLAGITPQSIFFTRTSDSETSTSGRTSGDGETSSQGDPSLRSVTDRSVPSHLARQRLQGHRVLSDGSMGRPGEDLRRRMVSASSAWGSLTPLDRPRSVAGAEAPLSIRQRAQSQRSISSSGQARLGLSKAAAAVGESSASAVGKMSEVSTRMRKLGVSPGHQQAGSESAATVTPGAAATAAPAFKSTYAGSDPYIQAHLEMVFLRNFRDKGADLESRQNAAARRRGLRNATPSHPSRVSVSGAGGHKRPDGRLLAYFNEHTSAITTVATSSDHAFFATGSEDGTIKIWDTARLEKNVTSHSRITYSAHHGKITALTVLDRTHCIVSAAVDGSLHVWRVEVSGGSLPKYSKPRLVSNFQFSAPGEHTTALLQSSPESPSARLILGTSQSRITILDLRTMSVLQTLRNPPHVGPITCMCSDKDRIWLVTGTLGGNLVLWDLRFGLMIKTWPVGGFDDSQAAPKVTSCTLHPSKGRGRWVMVSFEVPPLAGGSNKVQTLIETWDIDRGALVETFEVASVRDVSTLSTPARNQENTQRRGSSAIGKTDNILSPAQAIEDLVRRRDERDGALPPSGETNNVEGGAAHAPSQVNAFVVATEGYSSGPLGTGNAGHISAGWLDAGKLASEVEGDVAGGRSGSPRSTALVAGHGDGPAGYMITGGEDCRLRFWDLGRPERGVCFGGVTNENHSADSSRNSQFKGIAESHNDGRMRYVHALPPSSGQSQTTLRSPLLSQQQSQQAQSHMRAHRDAVTAVAVIESPFRCVVAGDRTGAVKVWS